MFAPLTHFDVAAVMEGYSRGWDGKDTSVRDDVTANLETLSDASATTLADLHTALEAEIVSGLRSFIALSIHTGAGS